MWQFNVYDYVRSKITVINPMRQLTLATVYYNYDTKWSEATQYKPVRFIVSYEQKSACNTSISPLLSYIKKISLKLKT